MHAATIHPWDVTPAEARRLQTELATAVSLDDALSPDAIRLVAGVDNGYVKHPSGYAGYAAVPVFAFPSLDPVETVYGDAPVAFPYIPGFLTFREGPAILSALERLTAEPDVLLIDGHGYAHPRRLGIATHVGVLLDRPTIGCAKTKLTGRYEEPADEFGAATPLVDRGEVVGMAVRTRPGHTPLFVSPGHKVSVESAVRIVLACCRDNGFLPVPTQAAHDAVTAYTKPLRGKR